jgi:hypothetical protein
MIGMNEGNGHPFSYSALFNGYDPDELQKRCPFELIKQYLPLEHRNEIFIEGAHVTHLWTQDPALSENISRVAKIPNVVDELTDLIGKVDAVILARDDPWNHYEMAMPFIKAGMPIFIDKQLMANSTELEAFLSSVDEHYPLMAGSSTRFTRDLAQAKQCTDLSSVRSIHGMSRVSWMRYGHHLLEAIVCLFGTSVKWVRSLSDDPSHDIVQLKFHSGLNVILEFVEKVQLPIQFTCFSETQTAFSVPFTDYFYSFREMMKSFIDLIKHEKKVIPFSEMITIAKIILAGDISKKMHGVKICPQILAGVEN